MISLKRRLGEAEGGGPSTEIAKTVHPEQSLRGDSEVAERASSSRRVSAVPHIPSLRKGLQAPCSVSFGGAPGRAGARAWRPRSCAGPRWRSAEASGSEWSASRPHGTQGARPEPRLAPLYFSCEEDQLETWLEARHRPPQNSRGVRPLAGALQAELEQLAPPEGREEAPRLLQSAAEKFPFLAACTKNWQRWRRRFSKCSAWKAFPPPPPPKRKALTSPSAEFGRRRQARAESRAVCATRPFRSVSKNLPAWLRRFEG